MIHVLDILLSIVLVGWVPIVVVDFIYTFRQRWSSREGSLPINDTDYIYKIGESINNSADEIAYNGMEVVLPKSFPHIYLDSHADSPFRGPLAMLDTDQKLSLEGDFNSHFQLFAKNGYEALALTVLSPDILALMVDNFTDYDIEIDGFYLRIMTKKPVGEPEQQGLIRLGTLLLERIDRKNRTWSRQDEIDTMESKLSRKMSQTFKIGKNRYVSVGHIAIAYVAFAVPVVITYVYLLMYTDMVT